MQKLAKAGDATEASLAPPFREIRAACAAISNAASLIDPMLPRARAVKDTFELIEFIEDYVKRRKGTFEREEISVNCVESKHGVSVRINRSRLLQVLDNLVRNSVYWLRRGHMTKEVTRPKAIHIEVTSTGFTVADSGCGVDPRFEDSLFEMFVTAKPDRDEGQGLGLFIATQLVEMDGGELTLDAERNPEGRRYRFSVDLRSSLVKAGS